MVCGVLFAFRPPAGVTIQTAVLYILTIAALTNIPKLYMLTGENPPKVVFEPLKIPDEEVKGKLQDMVIAFTAIERAYVFEAYTVEIAEAPA